MDGSELSENAAAATAAWARAAGASVVLVTVRDPDDVHDTYFPSGYSHVVTPQGTWGGQLLRNVSEPDRVVAEDRGQALERARVEVETYLSGVADRFFKGVDCGWRVEWSDNTPAGIASAAEAVGADLVAIGTHGRSGVSHALLGSVAEAVVRRSPVPVLVARDGMRLVQ
jgi:nucleotide-binding universal stress UspA family protein